MKEIDFEVIDNKTIDFSLDQSVIKISPELEDITIIPSKESQQFKSKDYYGYDTINVNAVDSSVDSNIQAENIKMGVEILGIEGSLEGVNGEEITVTQNGTYTPAENKNAITKVIVNVPEPSGTIEINSNGIHNVKENEFANVNVPEKLLIEKTITSNGTYNATDDGADGYNIVNVETSGVDINEYFETTITSTNASYFGRDYFLKDSPTIYVASGVTTLANAFKDNTYLKKIKIAGEIANVKIFKSMFSSCINLETVELDTSGATDVSNMFNGASKLKRLDKLNASKMNVLSNMFSGTKSSFTDFGGLENLGMNYSTSYSANYIAYKLDLSYCSALTHDSLMNVINNLYDIASKGIKTQQLVLGETNLAKLSEEEIATATNKGWSIS